MDPASIIVVLLAAWAIAQRTPGIIGQAAGEWRAGLGGESTPAAEALRQHLADEGVEPSTGKGPLGNFLSNLWRQYWHNRDQERQRAQAEKEAAEDASWWQRRLAAAEERHASQYRGGTDGGKAPEPGDPAAPPPDGAHGRDTDPRRKPGPESQQPPKTPADEPGQAPSVDDPQPSRPPIHVPSTLGPEPGSPEPAPRQLTTEPADKAPADTHPPEPEEPNPTEPAAPLLVPSVLGPEPTGPGAVAVLTRPTTQPQTERNQPMGTAVATNGVAITSMTSGAYEMGSINARLHEAVNNFVLELTQLQNRLVRAGESTLGTVQLAGHSTVMKSMSQSVEAISALKAAARGCATEVSPLVTATKREFEKRI